MQNIYTATLTAVLHTLERTIEKTLMSDYIYKGKHMHSSRALHDYSI